MAEFVKLIPFDKMWTGKCAQCGILMKTNGFKAVYYPKSFALPAISSEYLCSKCSRKKFPHYFSKKKGEVK